MIDGLRTRRLTLVPATLEHLDAELHEPAALGGLLGARVPASWPPGEYDRDAIQYFRRRLSESGPEGAGWFAWYAVEDGEGRVPRDLVAAIGYFGPPEAGIVEVGYSVAPEHRGRGLATEAVAALVASAFARGASCVRAHVAPDNHASKAVLAHLGFVRVGDPEGRREWRFEIGVRG